MGQWCPGHLFQHGGGEERGVPAGAWGAAWCASRRAPAASACLRRARMELPEETGASGTEPEQVRC